MSKIMEEKPYPKDEDKDKTQSPYEAGFKRGISKGRVLAGNDVAVTEIMDAIHTIERSCETLIQKGNLRNKEYIKIILGDTLKMRKLFFKYVGIQPIDPLTASFEQDMKEHKKDHVKAAYNNYR